MTEPAGSDSRVLVACFTRTGNTRLIAIQIARALDATLFPIAPTEAYPRDYEAQVAQAESERRRGHEPPLRATVPNVRPHGAVFLGFPIGGTTAPMVARSFLSRHDLSGKTLVPFITHGGYRLGSSLAVVAETRRALVSLRGSPSGATRSARPYGRSRGGSGASR